MKNLETYEKSELVKMLKASKFFKTGFQLIFTISFLILLIKFTEYIMAFSFSYIILGVIFVATSLARRSFELTEQKISEVIKTKDELLSEEPK